MRALIVDDEIHAREELEALLLETGEFQIVGKCANGLEAIQAVRQHRPDVLFLDIQMPVIGGFEVLSMIEDEVMPAVVFVTAFDDYALKAFDESALDYLLKPVERPRLARTVQRLKKMIRDGDRPAYQLAPVKKIPCVSGNRLKLIDVGEVEYVKSEIAGVFVVSGKGESFTELTLKVLEARASLIRCHRQYLVNMDHVDEIIVGENLSAMITTRSGRAIPVSRRYLKRLKEILGLYTVHRI
ncbi:MAG: two-component system response regulator BtsR [Syntrophobacteraceae bacterium]